MEISNWGFALLTEQYDSNRMLRLVSALTEG